MRIKKKIWILSKCIILAICFLYITIYYTTDLKNYARTYYIITYFSLYRLFAVPFAIYNGTSLLVITLLSKKCFHNNFTTHVKNSLMIFIFVYAITAFLSFLNLMIELPIASLYTAYIAPIVYQIASEHLFFILLGVLDGYLFHAIKQ